MPVAQFAVTCSACGSAWVCASAPRRELPDGWEVREICAGCAREARQAKQAQGAA
jgi:hypothetical protein